MDVVHEDILRLKDTGYLSRLNRDRLEIASPLDGANLALNINLTSVCNLGCTYCFAEGGDYGRIKGKLNADTDLDSILGFVSENTVAGDAVRFEFFGGEPMMNFDAIEALCERSARMAEQVGIRFLYRISTNLTTRLSERELSLFERFGFTVSVSIDGGAATHDRNRPNLAGRGSFQSILQNCHRVRARSEAITLVARMTYVPLPESSLLGDVRELHAENIFDWFQILPAVVDDSFLKPVFGDTFAGKSRAEIDALCDDKVEAEYKKLSDAYLSLFRPDNRFKGVLEIETIIRMILLGEVANGHCSGGRKYFTFSPDKSVMPCHRLVGEPALQSGTFKAGVDAATTTEWRSSINQTPVCSDCAIRYLCSGGCKQENLVRSGNLNRPDPRSCRFQFRLVDSAIETIGRAGPDLLGRDRSVLNDLFVSCGRPTLNTDRAAKRPPRPELRSLVPLT
ncbi:MAG: hypothetical protein BM562_07020 [Alphaproteobacteria bacterium MedPE-SWcel]|nr:MAG: hypothetical protein BM562_07020 [Alphaproteobacteria bacterium MedPE-SWcel]